MHLIVEAKDRKSLTRAMKSFGNTVAKNVNLRLASRVEGPRRGAVIDGRYHLVRLRTPAQVRAAVSYVLNNWRKHGEDRRVPGPPRRADRYSSGPYFTGWSVPPPPLIDMPFPEDGPLPIRPPTSWLLRIGWKQYGLISPWERPSSVATS